MEIINLKEKNIERGILSETYHVVPFFSNGHLVRVKTEDNVLLHGFFNEPDEQTDKIFIFMHGARGNFYGGKVQYLESTALECGYAFLTVNSRGHDYEGNFEIIKDCVYDFNAWIAFAKAKKFNEIVLCGHSIATHKILYFLTAMNQSLIKKSILLSPSNNIALWERFVKDQASYFLSHAKKLVEEKHGEMMMPKDSYNKIISAQTYLDRFSKDTLLDNFNFHDSEFDFKRIKAVNLPTLVITGDEDIYLEKGYHLEYMRKLESMNSNIQTKVIKGADHSFNGKEEELRKVIKEWLKEE